MTTKKQFFATRDFTDAGQGKAFASGDDLTSEPGLDNYVHAGLASDERPEKMLQAIAKAEKA